MLQGTCHCAQVSWTFDGLPESATACNCTLCRRYGVLWVYDYEGEKIQLRGTTGAYTRKGKADPALEILFCTSCGCVAAWRGLRARPDGRRRMAVNLRLAEPSDEVLNMPIDHFDGLETFDDKPGDGLRVRDLWA